MRYEGSTVGLFEGVQGYRCIFRYLRQWLVVCLYVSKVSAVDTPGTNAVKTILYGIVRLS